ncbi:acyl-CoA thioesterase [Aestuariimicrobium kwangyangense]|uniref:acyl-CoA thioesterase n=1 Tax=Aestuariimicrobium kwangyangense TaxID=396389 RepID=UPI0003B6CABB|nr:thioesterase family protein [Aestuariimicrobium kwangyangense]
MTTTMRVEVPLRWGDMDAQAHVNNGMVAEYLQEARVDFLHAAGVTEMLETGVVVISHQIEYLAPITYSPRPVVVDLGITHIGGARFEVAYLLSHDGVECARARSVLCPFDLASQQVRRLSAGERGWFERHRIEVEPFRDLQAPALLGRGVAHPLRPRWSDVDRFGHVNNVRLFDYVQEARIAASSWVDPSMLRHGSSLDPAHAAEEHSLWLVARQDVEYLAQIPYRVEPYRVDTGVARLGNSSVTFAAEVVDPLAEDQVLVRARTVLVCADDEGRPKQLPATTRSRLGRELVRD